MRADTPYKSVDDIRKATTAPKCGATGIASTGYYMPKLMEEVLGTKFDIVSGYVSGQDIDLAVERGELQCRAFTITAYHAREPFISWRKKNFTNVLIQTGTKRDPRLKESPTIYEVMDQYKVGEAGTQPRQGHPGFGRLRPPSRFRSGSSGGSREDFARCLRQDGHRRRFLGGGGKAPARDRSDPMG